MSEALESLKQAYGEQLVERLKNGGEAPIEGHSVSWFVERFGLVGRPLQITFAHDHRDHLNATIRLIPDNP